MIRNLMILVLLTWVSFSYASDKAPPIAQESLAEAEAFRVEKPNTGSEAKRALAGGKVKKNKKTSDEALNLETTEIESDVRYWPYSE